jgi:hypothetical protein
VRAAAGADDELDIEDDSPPPDTFSTDEPSQSLHRLSPDLGGRDGC